MKKPIKHNVTTRSGAGLLNLVVGKSKLGESGGVRTYKKPPTKGDSHGEI